MEDKDTLSVYSNKNKSDIPSGTLYTTVNKFVKRIQNSTTENLAILVVNKTELSYVFRQTYPISRQKKQQLFKLLFSQLQEDAPEIANNITGFLKIQFSYIDGVLSFYIQTENNDEIIEFVSNSDKYSVSKTMPDTLLIIQSVGEDLYNLLTTTYFTEVTETTNLLESERRNPPFKQLKLSLSISFEQEKSEDEEGINVYRTVKQSKSEHLTDNKSN